MATKLKSQRFIFLQRQPFPSSACFAWTLATLKSLKVQLVGMKNLNSMATQITAIRPIRLMLRKPQLPAETNGFRRVTWTTFLVNARAFVSLFDLG